MTLLAVLFLLQQAGNPTVGDTVWIERALGDVGNATVRPQPWSLGALGLQLGPAELSHGARGAVVRYALVIWYPGEHQLTMPGPVLVRRDGSSDTLATATFRVRIESVLPAGRSRGSIPPRPPSQPVPLEARSLLPVGIATGFLALVLGAVAFRWRRRGKPPPRPAAVPVWPSSTRLQAWAAAGEYRAALDGWAWIFARRLALSRDLGETATVQRVLDEIEVVVFSPRDTEHLADLAARAVKLGGGG